jgi:hypothetical protein
MGRRYVLDFTCRGEHFRLTSAVARTRLEPASGYTTGIRFVDTDDVTIERLEALLAQLAVAMFVRPKRVTLL